MIFSIQTFIENYFHNSQFEDPNSYAIKLATYYYKNRIKNDENSFLSKTRNIQTSFFRINSINNRSEFEKTLIKILDKKFYKDLVDNSNGEKNNSINQKEPKNNSHNIINSTKKKITQLNKKQKSFGALIGLLVAIVACFFGFPGFINETRILISDIFIARSPTVISTQVPVVLSLTPSPTSSPTITKTSTATVDYNDFSNLVITEIMANPCDGIPENEYIELFNSGDNTIDVNGLWLSDGQETDQIVSFQTRFPSINIGYNTITNTTLLNPQQYAVILAPGYPLVQGSNRMPYAFPENTLILTTIDGYLLGDDINGIQVSNPDMIILYQGTNNVIDHLISSYGNPLVGTDPTLLKKPTNNKFPFLYFGNHCKSIERIFPNNEDNEKNWFISDTSSPGEGNYPIKMQTPTPE